MSTLLRQFARCESERRPSILQRINLSEAKKVMQNSRRQGRLYCCAGRFKIVWASFPAIHILRIMPTKNYPPPGSVFPVPPFSSCTQLPTHANTYTVYQEQEDNTNAHCTCPRVANAFILYRSATTLSEYNDDAGQATVNASN